MGLRGIEVIDTGATDSRIIEIRLANLVIIDTGAIVVVGTGAVDMKLLARF